jgi:hypothetical protein
VSDPELVIADAVVPHQKTTGEPFVDFAATGGGRGVVGLYHRDVDERRSVSVESRPGCHDLAQRQCGDAQRGATGLNQGLIG